MFYNSIFASPQLLTIISKCYVFTGTDLTKLRWIIWRDKLAIPCTSNSSANHCGNQIRISRVPKYKKR